MKRFQVSDKFAGKKGPCPNCQVIIEIPKDNVIIHEPDHFSSGGKTIKGRAILKPISRINTDFSVRGLVFGLLGTVAVILLAIVLNAVLPEGAFLRNLIALIGLLGVAFPLVYFGHQILRDSEDIEPLEGQELIRRSAIAAGAYVFLWCIYEMLIRYLQADELFVFLYMAPIVLFSVFVVHILYDFDLGRGFLHYLVFLAPVVLLRGLIGIGWIWEGVTVIASATGVIPPPPPPPPGLR